MGQKAPFSILFSLLNGFLLPGMRVLLCFILLFLSLDGYRCQNFPLSPKATQTLVDSLARQLSRYYIEKAAATKMSARIRQRLKEGRYNDIADPHRLAGLLTADIQSVHRDEHFHVEYNPILANEISGNIEDVPGMVAEKLRQEKSRNFGFRKTEVLNGNIGYLEISSFSRLNEYSKKTADAALLLLSNCDALIIDLRYGAGGSPEMVTHLLSRFFRERTHVSDIFIRSENATLPYYTTPDSTFANLQRIPVYILTSYKTFSAAEGFTYAMKNLRRATVIGETTRGGAHTVTYRPLSGGFVADIPFGRAMNPVNGKNWELVGIEPDIRVESEAALETAEKKIFELAMSSTREEAELRRLRWHYKLLESANHPYSADTSVLKGFTGDYGAYNISFDRGCLYYQKTGKAKFPLVPVSGNCLRPKGNDSFIVEFEETGNSMRLTTTYDDGRIELADRLR
jgi:retinol-binding protein 3